MTKPLFTRRDFMRSSVAATAGTLLLPHFGRATLQAEKTLKLYNIHTGEWFKGVYAVNGVHVPESVKNLNHFMRDFRTGEVISMDPALLDLIHRLKEAVAETGPFEVISGYRSPQTNAKLRAQGRKVAKNSYHMRGKAVDLRGSGDLRHLRDAARTFQAGGVGYYAKSRFVHMDTRGTPKFW